MKMIYRPRLWVMLAILIFAVFSLAVFMYNGNRNSDKMMDMWGFVASCTELLFISKIFAVVIAGDIVASEFTWGTIKLLLIRPANRTKILLAKYLTVILYAIFFMLFILLSSLLLGYLFFHNQSYVQQNLFTPSKTLSVYLPSLVSIVMDVTFSFMISTVFRSSSLAIGLSIFLMFAGSASVQLFHHFNISWGRYILYANTDLTQYFPGNQALFKGMTLHFSIFMLVIYFAIFHLLTWVSFVKRDVDV